RLFVGEVDHPLGARRQLHVLAEIAMAAGHLPLDIGADAPEGHAEAVEDPGGDAVTLTDQSQQPMFRADVILAEARRFFLREEDHSPRPFCEPLPHRVLTPPTVSSGRMPRRRHPHDERQTESFAPISTPSRRTIAWKASMIWRVIGPGLPS